MPQIKWEDRARAKRASLYASIPPKWRLKSTDLAAYDGPRDVSQLPRKFLTAFEIAVTEGSPLIILSNIHLGVWSAEDVTEAFCHRAAIAHQLINCLTEILFDAALKKARQLDQHRLVTGGLKGPLHGLPCSFMDRFRIAGAETGAGYVGWLGKLEDEASESLIVKQMRSLGAVPFCKTNMPMSMMLGETTNNITGSTLNPFVRTLSSGGAAGGEGALLAMRGSPLGWATEVAGSTRIPAAFNGLYALRSSSGRLTAKGVASSMEGLPVCGHVVAPVSTELGFLKHIMKCVIGSQTSQEDPNLIDIPWRMINTSIYRPSFAVLRCDGNVLPQPPISRALDMVVCALHGAGYQVIEWHPPAHAPAVRNLFEILGSDGARGVRDALELSGEPPVPQLATWFYQQDNGPLPTTEFWALCQKRATYRSEYQEYWNSTKEKTLSKRPVDGVILPIAADAAAQENSLTYFGMTKTLTENTATERFAAYSAIANLLDYSAASFPVTTVDKNIDLKIARKMLSEEDKSIWQKCKSTYRRLPNRRLIRAQTILNSLTALLSACKSCVEDFKKRKFWNFWIALPPRCLV